MKKILNISLVLVTVAMLAYSCTVIVPVTASSAKIGDKKGVSTTASLGGVIEFNKNYSVAEACENGNITGPVSIVDEKVTSYFGIFQVKELIVIGQ